MWIRFFNLDNNNISSGFMIQINRHQVNLLSVFILYINAVKVCCLIFMAFAIVNGCLYVVNIANIGFQNPESNTVACLMLIYFTLFNKLMSLS